MAKAKTLRPSTVVDGALGRVARWVVADGIVLADQRGVYIDVEAGHLTDVEELGLALKSAHLFYLNVKEAV